MRMDAPVVLHVQAGVPIVIDLGGGRVLLEAGGDADEEIGQGVAGLLAVETPHAVVVERGVLDELLKRSIDAELDGMLAAVEGERIAQAVVVAAGHRALDRLAERHITADGDLGKRLHALRGEFRAEVAEVDVWRLAPAAAA